MIPTERTHPAVLDAMEQRRKHICIKETVVFPILSKNSE